MLIQDCYISYNTNSENGDIWLIQRTCHTSSTTLTSSQCCSNWIALEDMRIEEWIIMLWKNFSLTSLVSVGIFLCRNSSKKPEVSLVAKHAHNQHSEPPMDQHRWLDRTNTRIQVSAKKQQIHHCRRLAHLQLHLWPWAWCIFLSSDSATSRPTFGKQSAGKHRRTLLARGLDLPWMAGSTACLLSHLCRIWKLHSFWQSPVPRIGFRTWTLQQAIPMGREARYLRWCKWCLPRGVSREGVHSWADGGLGTAAEGSEPSFCCLLLKPLWLELYHGRSKQWGPLPLLALLWWSDP